MLFANVLWAQTIFQEKGKYGIKAENEVLVKPIYDKISVLQGGIEFDPETFEETDNVKSYLLEQGGLYQVVMRDDWENIFPKKGISGILMPPKDQEIDFLIVEQKGKWGAIDLLEALGWFIEPSYEGMGYFGRDNFTAKKKGKWGMLDLEQQEAVGFEYDAIEASPIETIFQAKKNGQFKLYGWEGGEVYEMLPDVSYDSLKDAELGYLYFFREGKVGLLSLTKGIVIPAKYDKMAVGGKIMEEGDDFGFGDDWGFGNDFSSAGDSWNNAELQRVPQEHTEVTLGKLKGLFKMNEETGATEVFPAEFEDYRFKDQFSLNQFLLKKSGKWGLFSTADMALKDVKHTYSEASFSGWNIVFESENGKKGLMERNGNIILEADYEIGRAHV